MSEKEMWYRGHGWRIGVVTVAAAVVATCMPAVANAYGAHLVMMPAPIPAPIGSFGGFRPAPINNNAAVPLHSSILANMSATALKTPTRALWNMYPASVRGRVFGGNGGDPIGPSAAVSSGGGW